VLALLEELIGLRGKIVKIAHDLVDASGVVHPLSVAANLLLGE